jgi:hypothetical protein
VQDDMMYNYPINRIIRMDQEESKVAKVAPGTRVIDKP